MTDRSLVYSAKQGFSKSTIVDVLFFYSLCMKAQYMLPYEIQYKSE